MTQDALFEDGGEQALRLLAYDAEDLKVLSTLTQDAVFPASEMSWQAGKRRFSLLINRFRWEDAQLAEARGRTPERVQSVLSVSDVLKVKSQGVSRDADTILSLLTLSFTPTQDGMGTLELTLAGDGAISLEVEALDVTLQDVTRPYIAPSKHTPEHPE
ncbi:DUF2948 family protein [Aliiroseovarius lamellibrachiae]|uniref:DUF2948 family protein n=1 Tax=Aliiroseovarius lamellibrachiae TaxID=1924933 RepID=UPI001BE106BC|nr:DUF2948 family protein [Aliiroseovarius lamellibrachiae]MBT2130616.1 DUF2948 family protein [Aliiroseovarius lamellibrachiae]